MSWDTMTPQDWEILKIAATFLLVYAVIFYFVYRSKKRRAVEKRLDKAIKGFQEEQIHIVKKVGNGS